MERNRFIDPVRAQDEQLNDLNQPVTGQAFTVYSLRAATLNPCSLGEAHRISGNWEKATHIYAS